MDSENKYCYRYPHPAVTVDCVIFGFDGRGLKIILIERGLPPYEGYWALPGGFVKPDETLEEGAARELFEETGLANVYMEQFKAFSRPDRDPRERVITIGFIGLVKPDDYKLLAGDDAAKAFWFDEDTLPPLAFDHREIIREAREHLKEIQRLKPVAFQLLSKTFSISELQKIYEVINRASYDRRNFLRTAVESDTVLEVGSQPEDSSSSETCCCCCEPAPAFRPAPKRQKLYTANPAIFEDGDGESDSGSRASSDVQPKNAPTKGLFDFLFRK